MSKAIPFKTAYGSRKRVSFETTGESLTKQAFKNECNINNIMRKWRSTGVISHIRSSSGQYGDFSGVSDYQSALNAVMNAQDSFMALPSQLRSRFENDPAKFLAFTQDPNNFDEMVALGLAEAPQAPVQSDVVVDQAV